VSLRVKIAVGTVALTVLGVLAWVLFIGVASSPSPAAPMSELPPEVTQTWQLIQSGGPFPYEQDGRTFGNREGLLPRQPDGYYREYTVPTPEEPDRGARRLVTGRDGEVYYTEDHYRSFLPVDPSR
jgi:ribonuclease T1